MPRYSLLKVGAMTADKLLLDSHDHNEGDAFLSQHRRPTKVHWIRKHWRSIMVHSTLLATNLLLLIFYATDWVHLKALLNPQNTFANIMRYEPQKFQLRNIYQQNGELNPHKMNSFNGPPRPELEDEWKTLLKHESIRVQRGELGQFVNDDTIIELEDGSGYYVTVAAFHGLHCVQRLHHFIYTDDYYSDLSETEVFLLKQHTEHCLDWLRQYVMCNADPTLLPMRWAANNPYPAAGDLGNHQCVVWEPIEEWMAAHSFDPFEPGVLVHPTFGNPYGGNETGHGKDLGLQVLGKDGYLHLHHDSGSNR